MWVIRLIDEVLEQRRKEPIDGEADKGVNKRSIKGLGDCARLKRGFPVQKKLSLITGWRLLCVLAEYKFYASKEMHVKIA